MYINVADGRRLFAQAFGAVPSYFWWYDQMAGWRSRELRRTNRFHARILCGSLYQHLTPL